MAVTKVVVTVKLYASLGAVEVPEGMYEIGEAELPVTFGLGRTPVTRYTEPIDLTVDADSHGV